MSKLCPIYSRSTMDSKQQFFSAIHNFYANIVGDQLTEELLNGLCNTIADYYYEQYTRFGNQHPKSIKRYSTFHVKDLDHPYTNELVIKYLKKNTGSNYSIFARMVLGMSDDELTQFEKNREDFYNMW